MWRALRKIFLEEYGGVAKSRQRLALRFVEASREFRFVAHHAHAASAAAHGGFDDHREADFGGDLFGLVSQI